MTIQELRVAIAALPDDMEVLVDAYEMGLIHPASVEVCPVAQRDTEWRDINAPMLGTHCYTIDARPEDGPSFNTLCIKRP